MVKRKKTTLKNKQIHHKHFFVGGVAAFFLAGLLLGGAVSIDLANKGQFNAIHAFKPAQVISNDSYDVQLSGVTRGSGESGSLQLAKDKTYLIVDLYVKNKSSKVLPLYPLAQTYIKDEQGQTYGVGPAMVLRPFQAGDLAAGDKIKGQIAFEIPSSLENPRFYLEGLSEMPVVVQF